MRQKGIGKYAAFVFFLPVMLIALILVVGLWNGVSDFKTAYFQSLLRRSAGSAAYILLAAIPAGIVVWIF